MDEFEKFVLKCKLTGIIIEYAKRDFGYIVSSVKGNFVKEFRLPEGVVSVGVYCFKNFSCETLILPSTCVALVDYCCYGMSSLVEVICNDVNIHNCAFAMCTNLRRFQANSILKLGKSCFDSCTSLSVFDFNNASFDIIGAYAFNSCTSLSVFDFKNVNFDIIGAYAFNDCCNLSTLLNFDELSPILLDDNCFCNCVSLEHVSLPNNIILRAMCFSNCTGLQSLTFKDFDSVGIAIIKGCSDNMVVNIPEKYKSLDLKLFLYGDSSLDLSENVRFY